MKEGDATGRRYDREFKQNAVELVRAGGTVSRVARDLGVSTWSLGAGCRRPTGAKRKASRKPSPPRATRNANCGVYARRTTTCASKETFWKRAPKHLVGGDAIARHVLMETMKNDYPVAAMAEALEVSKSGCFAHRHKEVGLRRQEDARLAAALEPIFEESWRSYGSLRVAQEPRVRGQFGGKNWVARG